MSVKKKTILILGVIAVAVIIAVGVCWGNISYNPPDNKEMIDQVRRVWNTYVESSDITLSDVRAFSEDNDLYIRFTCEGEGINNGQPFFVCATNSVQEEDWVIVDSSKFDSSKSDSKKTSKDIQELMDELEYSEIQTNYERILRRTENSYVQIAVEDILNK